MRLTALTLALLTLSSTTLGFKYKAALPTDSKGHVVSHALPLDNLPLVGKTAADIGISVGVLRKTGDGATRGAPARRRRLEKRTEYTPTAAELANITNMFNGHLPPHNPTSGTKKNGAVAIFSVEQGFMGFIRLSLSQYATTGLTPTITDVAYVTLPKASPSPHFDLGIANASDPFLAVIQGYSGSNWGVGNPGYGSMTVVQHSTYPASNTNNPTFLPSESNIWSLTTASGSGGKRLTATWFNDNGTPVPCTIYFDITYGDFGFTGDLAQYVKLYLDNVVAVSLYFIPLW